MNEYIELFKKIRKPLWRLISLTVPLCSTGYSFGLFIYYYFFEHSYAQSCVWALWCVFSLIVYKVKTYESE